MKAKTLIAILTILITVIATAQDRGPGQRGLILDPLFGYVNLSSDLYPFSGPDSLVIGFQWPNNLSIANAVYCNHNALTPQFTRKRLIINGDTTYPIDSDKAPNGAYLTLNGLDATDPAKAIHSIFSHNLQDTAILQDAEHWGKLQCFQKTLLCVDSSTPRFSVG